MSSSYNYQKPALIWSAVFHVFLLLFAVFGLPEIWKDHRESLPTAMSVEVLPITEISNIKRQQQQKKESDKKFETATAKKAVSESSTAVKKEPEKKDVVTPPKPKEPEKKKPEPKKEEKPKEKPKPEKVEKKEVADLDSILKGVEDAAKKEQSDKPTESNEEKKLAKSDNYNPSLPMGMTEIDAIRSQFVKCWTMPAGARDAHQLIVAVNVRLNADGSVISAELGRDVGRYNSDSFFRAAADSAVRAVYKCSPLQNLPSNKYETWKFLQLNFDPSEALY